MSDTGFDYGAEAQEGASFKNPSLGMQDCRIRSIIHLGECQPIFKGKKQNPVNMAVAIFELSDEAEDDGTPLSIDKDFSLKKGEKATVQKIRKAADPKGVAKSFDDLIGAAVQVEIVPGGKEENDDGTPKYVNAGQVVAVQEKNLGNVSELAEGLGVGHVKFEDMTKDAIMELHPIRHIQRLMSQGTNYKGSKAESIVNEIRKENPDFAVKKEDDKKKGQQKESQEQAPSKPAPNMDKNQEF